MRKRCRVSQGRADLSNRPREPQHEKIVHAALAERLAVLLGLSYGGEYDPTRRYDAHPYRCRREPLSACMRPTSWG